MGESESSPESMSSSVSEFASKPFGLSGLRRRSDGLGRLGCLCEVFVEAATFIETLLQEPAFLALAEPPSILYLCLCVVMERISPRGARPFAA